MQKRSIIKGRCILTAVVVLAVVLLSVLLLQTQGSAGARALGAAQALNDYQFDLKFLPDDSLLNVTMTLDYRNDTGDTLSSLVLRTWANAYQAEEYSPAAIDELYDACYPDGFSAGSLTLEGVWWNDRIVTDHAYLDPAQTVLQIPIDPLAPGSAGTLLLRCRIRVPQCAHRFGKSGGVWQFGNALPILSVYENGSWQQDAYCPIGDPFVSECANYTVSLILPDGWQCAAGAKAVKDGSLLRMYAPAARDFAFALSQDWHVAEEKVGGVTVTAFSADKEGARRAARYAAKAIKTYSSLYGEYPYAHLTICEADFPLGGMEYPGFILIDDGYFYKDWVDTLELLIAHETAHQWFYALVGSDQYNAAWQDEALSEWAMLRYVKARYGQSAYENLLWSRIHAPMQENILSPVTPGSPIDYFGSYSDYSAVVYGRGAALLLAIEEMTGKADDFLCAYCDRFAFRLAKPEDFTLCLNEWSGMDLSPLILDYIDTYMN